MHGLMLRSLQGYLRDMFGAPLWSAVVQDAALPSPSFEPMLRYAPDLADTVAVAAARRLGRPVEVLWEDLGTYLVTNPRYEGVRRLLRFGGVGFTDFLYSLEELPGRARLALPELDVPDLALEELGPERFRLTCRFQAEGAGRVLAGILTAMADDYGALVVIEHQGKADGGDAIAITVLDARHTSGRSFDLAMPGVG
jgi:Haem-NO-binding